MEKEILVNPITAIRLFAKTYLTYREKLLNDRKFKVTREAWITSMYLLALEKNSSEKWWLAPVNDKSGSPDFNCYSFVRKSNIPGNIRQIRKVEVFEWRKEEKENDFVEALKEIKLNKIIDEELTLVCYIRRDINLPSLVSLHEQLKNTSIHVMDIWYLACVDNESKKWKVSQIYPNLMTIDLDYDEVLNLKEERSFINCYRGKSNEFKYENTDKKVLLTPEFELKELDK